MSEHIYQSVIVESRVSIKCTNLCLLELAVAHLQLHAALALVVLQPVHELRLLQVLVVELLPLRGQGLVAGAVLLQVGHHLVPLLSQALSVLTLELQLQQRQSKGGVSTEREQQQDHSHGVDAEAVPAP